MEAYVVNPIQSNETKIYNLVSNNFLSNKYVANDVLEKFLKGLGIKNQRDNQSPNDEKYLRELYSSFGLDYDIDEKKLEQFEENQYIKFGKKNEGISGFHKNLLSRKAYKNYKTSVKDIVKVKKESENKKSKNKSQNKKVKKIEKTEEKLNIVIEDLKNAKKTIFEKNKNQIDKVDDDVKNAYEYMLTNQNDKEKVVKFEEKILQKENTQKESMKRDIDNIISNKKLYEQFENIFESNFLDLSRKEFMDQVDYIFNNSKIDKDGKLIVPKDSIFRNVIFNENGEIRSGKEDVIDILSTNYELRKVKDLSNKDIEVIAKDFKDNRDESELDEKSKGYAFRKFIVSHPELVSSTYDILVDDLTDI